MPALIAPKIWHDGQEQGWLCYQPWFAVVTRRPLLASIAYLRGSCLLIRRKDNSLPLFDEDFFMYGEDVELCWRWRKEGGNLKLTTKIWIEHEGSASSGQTSEAYEYFLVSSHWRLASKLSSNCLNRKFMQSTRFFSLLARAFLRSIRYRSTTPLSIFLKFFVN